RTKFGQPAKDSQINADQKRFEYQDASEHNAIEGKFGEGKRCYGLSRISTCLQKTSETVIALTFMVMNIGKILRDSFSLFSYDSYFASTELQTKSCDPVMNIETFSKPCFKK